MSELCNELLDDIDFHFDKVKCRKIEGLMPRLMGMLESEMEGMTITLEKFKIPSICLKSNLSMMLILIWNLKI